MIVAFQMLIVAVVVWIIVCVWSYANYCNYKRRRMDAIYEWACQEPILVDEDITKKITIWRNNQPIIVHFVDNEIRQALDEDGNQVLLFHYEEKLAKVLTYSESNP